MTLEELKQEYDKMQLIYGAEELNSIYYGGCIKNPEICFVFMNPTQRNIAAEKTWKRKKITMDWNKKYMETVFSIRTNRRRHLSRNTKKKAKRMDRRICRRRI